MSRAGASDHPPRQSPNRRSSCRRFRRRGPKQRTTRTSERASRPTTRQSGLGTRTNTRSTRSEGWTDRQTHRRRSRWAAVPSLLIAHVTDSQCPQKPTANRSTDILPDALSPLRQPHDVTAESTMPSVELGRNSSPRRSPHASFDQPPTNLHLDATPSRGFSKSPSPAFTHATPKLDSPLASLDLNSHGHHNPVTPLIDQSAAQRRASHLLTTLRSTAKPRFARGTPHPHRSVGKPAPSAASPRAGRTPRDEDGDERTSSSFASDHSSNDLTTFHKANTSLPSGGTALSSGGGAGMGGGAGGSRFNGAKLNAYLHSLNTHLTEENASLVKTLQRTARDVERLQGETRRLEDTIREMSVVGGQSGVSDASRARTRSGGEGDEEDDEGSTSRVEMLGNELEGLVAGHRRIRGLQDQVDAADGRTITAADRIAELEAELDDRDGELEVCRKQMEEQEAEFADKMAELERELCAVMEEQEAKVERAREEVEGRRREDERARREERDKLERVERERDERERKLLEGASDAAKDMEAKVLALRGEVAALEETVATLRGDVAARDDELASMQEELETAERRVDELERGGDGGQGLADVVDELRQQVAQKDDELRQLEDALDDSAQQLVDHETVLADKEAALESLRAQLETEQGKTTALEARLSQLSVPKAKSPLANEVFNAAAQDGVISSLEEELEAARRECDDLRRQLASVTHEDESARLRELEVQQLESDKANLEDRVKSLRQQVSVQLSPGSNAGSRTPDKSWFLRPLPSVYTPKTPGQLFGNLSTFSPGSAANETISPLLSQIHELEQIVEHLQGQLSDANTQIDTKLDKLEAAGSGTISLARQLSNAQSRIAQLEGDLERLLGEGGSLERVRARLARVHCPECQASFDANKAVQLRVDRNGISFSDPPRRPSSTASPKADSLKTTLASVNAKLAELRTENDVLQQQASRSKELAADKARLVKQHDAVQRDLQHARGEIAVLETDLRTERSRLRNFASEQSLAGQAKAALEARLATAEAELAAVKRELSKAVAADVVERLRKEKDSLVSERADLLRQLADVNERASRVDSDLTTTKADHAALQAQLARQAGEIQTLRTSLNTKEAEQRLLQDERGDILRGVANLQADLNRVRQDAISLGLDLAAVRRERDELGAKKGGDEGELVRAREQLALARRKLAALEQQLAKHVCSPSSDSALAQLQTKHKSEVKGLLVLLRQLKLRVEREMDFRTQAGSQKRFLEGVVRDKQETIDSILTQLSLPLQSSPPAKPTSLRSVALAVVACGRMDRLARAWKEQSAPKKRLRDQVYQDVRGRPFPA
ncbi:hypothetical protein DMC30DRAFT_124475 [Rhodotorula diobovata]|uniref:Pericentrin/AKAP-450 centrosomal targeting domain-containing protein n=1 Tax=Rhodotorula diobovata TaxID=5288 RepID=A0A5C5G193_9BASI|nr:hypothetical protein DMC30DRAFT_124475 [Rhodotorula diobovata]